MMGVTISFNIPFAMGVVEKDRHEPLLLGLLCGIITTPVGCLVSALIVGLSITDLLASLIPLLVCAILLAVALFLWPRACVKVFKVFGMIINTIILFGLAVGIFEGLTGIELVPYTAPINDAFEVCTNAAMVMSGAFPLIHIISKILDKPMKKFGGLIGINTASALGFLSTLATNMTTYGNMQDMDDKGLLLNSAFSVSAGFVFAGHLAFTLAFNADYSVSMMVGKVVSGIAAVFVALLLHKLMNKKSINKVEETVPQEV
jgi:ethanolamine transporter